MTPFIRRAIRPVPGLHPPGSRVDSNIGTSRRQEQNSSSDGWLCIAQTLGPEVILLGSAIAAVPLFRELGLCLRSLGRSLE